MKKLLRSIPYLLSVLIGLPACHLEQKQEKLSSAPEIELTTKPGNPADSLGQFEFTTSFCENSGTYLKRKFTEEQLRNTYHLYEFEYPVFKTDKIIDRPEDVTNEKVAQTIRKLDKEYDSLKTKFQNGEIVKVPFWANIQKLRLLELQEFYKIYWLTLQAHIIPDILVKSPYAKPCIKYVKAIAATDTATLFQGRRRLLKEMQNNNGDPEKLARRYKEEYNSPDRSFWARRELLIYGWGNCANHQRKYIDTDNEFPLEQEFEKLFVKIKADCQDLD